MQGRHLRIHTVIHCLGGKGADNDLFATVPRISKQRF